MHIFTDLLRTGYHSRDERVIEQLLPYVDENCAVIGTALGELGCGRDAVAQLLRDDFDGWVDVEINDSVETEAAGRYSVCTLSATGLYRFTVNDACYTRYAGYMRDIASEPIPGPAKAIKAIWELDHLIASKPGVRHTEKKPFRIRLLVDEGRILVISFDFPMLKNHVDCFSGIQQDMDEDFLRDFEALPPDGPIARTLIETASVDGLRFVRARAQSHGSVFFGCGTLRNDVPIDEEIEKDFRLLDGTESPYRKLYLLRRRLGETLRLYSCGSTQEIMVRFFGVAENGRVAYLAHSYPFYWILED